MLPFSNVDRSSGLILLHVGKSNSIVTVPGNVRSCYHFAMIPSPSKDLDFAILVLEMRRLNLAACFTYFENFKDLKPS